MSASPWTKDCRARCARRSSSFGKTSLLYRAERLINWCPRCKTALADIEVVHEEADGNLWHIRYPLADDPAQALIVATTRPETMLGDTAVAVHPEDERYQQLVGKKIRLPITGRIVPLIADAYVDQGVRHRRAQDHAGPRLQRF